MINDGFMIAEVIFRHVFCRKTAKNGVMIVLLMRQNNLSYFQLFNCRINNNGMMVKNCTYRVLHREKTNHDRQTPDGAMRRAT